MTPFEPLDSTTSAAIIVHPGVYSVGYVHHSIPLLFCFHQFGLRFLSLAAGKGDHSGRGLFLSEDHVVFCGEADLGGTCIWPGAVQGIRRPGEGAW